MKRPRCPECSHVEKAHTAKNGRCAYCKCPIVYDKSKVIEPPRE